MADGADLHWATDEILIVLNRESDGPVSKTALIEQTGIGTSDLREALDDLIKNGMIEDADTDEGGGFKLTGKDFPLDEAQALASGSDESLASQLWGDEGGSAEQLDQKVHGLDYKVTLELTGTFGKGEKGTEQEAMARAHSVAQEVGNLLGLHMPGLIKGGSVSVVKLEAFETKIIFSDEG